MKLIIYILANGAGILIAQRWVPEVNFTGDILTLLMASAILAGINYFIKPLLKIISFPLIFISAGAFGFVLNGIILWSVTKIIPEFIIPGIIALFWTTIVISGVNILTAALIIRK